MKKTLKPILLVILFSFLFACSSIRVAADYDKETEFTKYKTFAFFKTGIDKAEINDLDKRRILRAIEAELLNKGLSKSKNPDMLVSIFTKSEQRVDVYNNAWGMGGWGGFGPGWGMGWGWNQPMVSTRTQGTLYIDFIDANKKELVWQGMGTGNLNTNSIEKKEASIKNFVYKIMEKYPPTVTTK